MLTQDQETVSSLTIVDSSNIILNTKNTQSLKLIKKTLIRKLYQIDKMFRKQYFLSIQLAQMFYQMKTLQLNMKFLKTKQIGLRKFAKHQIPTFLMLIQYVYVQTKYLQQMTQMNLEGQRKILKKHKKYAKSHVQTPAPNHSKINRFKKINNKFIDNIQDYYVQKNIYQQQTKDRRQFLRKTAQRVQTRHIDACLLGTWIGVSVCLITLLICILAINDINLDNDKKFARDFPTWRGIAIFIFYIWVLGFNIYMYEQYKITHRLIFKFDDHHYSTSINIFKFAGLHTSIFLVLFLLYILKLADVVNMGNFNQAYFALISWGAFLLCLFLPLPILNPKGRIYALKLVIKSILSPFIGVIFPIIWMTDQVVSLVTPLKDFAYTICYYTEIDFNTDKNPCKSHSRVQVILIVAVVALGYRMLQCMRQGYDKGQYLGTPFFWNTLKYGSSLITAVLAFVYKLDVQGTFEVWITFAAISTLYSYVWDLKMDWALLQKNDRHPFLRKYLSFQPARNYYIISLLNLIMRLSWILTLSPSIINLFGNSNIFTLVTGMIQIFRRGIWNLLRVQKQHLDNCGSFKAVPDTSHIQQELTKFQNNHDLSLILVRYARSFTSKRQEVYQSFLKLIRQKVQQKQQNQRKYNANFQKIMLQQIQSYVKQVFNNKPQLLKLIKKKRKQQKKKSKSKINKNKNNKQSTDKQSKTFQTKKQLELQKQKQNQNDKFQSNPLIQVPVQEDDE